MMSLLNFLTRVLQTPCLQISLRYSPESCPTPTFRSIDTFSTLQSPNLVSNVFSIQYLKYHRKYHGFHNSDICMLTHHGIQISFPRTCGYLYQVLVNGIILNCLFLLPLRVDLKESIYHFNIFIISSKAGCSSCCPQFSLFYI